MIRSSTCYTRASWSPGTGCPCSFRGSHWPCTSPVRHSGGCENLVRTRVTCRRGSAGRIFIFPDEAKPFTDTNTFNTQVFVLIWILCDSKLPTHAYIHKHTCMHCNKHILTHTHTCIQATCIYALMHICTHAHKCLWSCYLEQVVFLTVPI